MVKDAPEVPKFGLSVEECLFRHAFYSVREWRATYDSKVFEIEVENSKAIRVDSKCDEDLANQWELEVGA
jgi:hypothetical protein